MSETLFFLYLGVHLFSALVAGGLGYWSLFRTDMRSKRWFGLLMLGLFLWGFLSIVELLLTSPSVLLATQVASLGVGLVIPLLWVLFTTRYTYRSLRTNPVIYAFGIVCSLLVATALTTSLHGYYASFAVHQTPFSHVELISGPVRVFGIAYILTGMILGTYYLMSLFQQGSSPDRPTAILAGAVLLGIVPFFMSASGFVPIQTYDHTPFGISVFLFGVAYIVFKHNFYRLSPIAYEMIIENMTDPMIILDNKKRLINYNPAATKIFQRLNTDDIGTSLSTLNPELATTLKEARDSQHTAFEVSGTDGTRHFLVQITDLEPEGEVIGTVLLLREITELHTREQQLQHQNDRLDQFASIVSHDLRNPLGVAQGRLEMIGDTEHGPIVERNLNRMEEIISDVLTIAREGQAVEVFKPVDVEVLAANCWEQVETESATLSTDSSLTIAADPTRIQRLFENLLRNAVEHAGEDVSITIGSLRDGFYVEDDGPGIDTEHIGEIFEPGFTTNRGGTGFGLSIVKEIAEAHGWTVSITEGSTGGARFDFTGVESI